MGLCLMPLSHHLVRIDPLSATYRAEHVHYSVDNDTKYTIEVIHYTCTSEYVSITEWKECTTSNWQMIVMRSWEAAQAINHVNTALC